MSTYEFYKFLEKSIDISNFKELRVINTICDVTAKRESQTQEVARKSDLVIVLGGKNSSNTSKLAKIASQITKTVHIEEPSEVDEIDLSAIKTIGIVTGTSTPQEDVKTLTEKILNRREKE
jgi:4-hydroxy-3-methylbut-2-enyl diphosphate reductase